MMDKDPTKIETTISKERAHGLGEATMTLSFLKELDDFGVDDGPQHLGIIDPTDKLKAAKDPRTISAEVGGQLVPIFIPIEFHVDANQKFFEGKNAYLFNWQDYNDELEGQIGNKVAQIPNNALIMLEREAGDLGADKTLGYLINQYSGRRVDLTPESIDPETNTIPSVIYYYSEAHRPTEKVADYPDIKSAYLGLKDTEQWQKFTDRGVYFVSGEYIAPNLQNGKISKLLEDLWSIYDDTFNKLICNHPSDQKIPREYFDLLTTSPNSKVMYAQDEGQVVSALFIVEDLTDLPWLNRGYFNKLNHSGKTVFMPGVATKLSHKKALAYSPRLIEAMSFLGEHVQEITGVATQCTNISAQYIPRLTNRYTRDTMNLDMQQIAKYEYPVFRVI